jgi:hypothetical protein
LRALHTLPLPYHACAIRAKRHLLQLVRRTALQVWRLPAGCAGDQGFGGVESATKSKATTQIICKGASSIVGRTRGCRSGLGERDGGGDQGAPQVVTLQRGPFFSSFLPRKARNLPGLESKLVTCVLHPCEGGAGQASDFRLLSARNSLVPHLDIFPSRRISCMPARPAVKRYVPCFFGENKNCWVMDAIDAWHTRFQLLAPSITFL